MRVGKWGENRDWQILHGRTNLRTALRSMSIRLFSLSRRKWIPPPPLPLPLPYSLVVVLKLFSSYFIAWMSCKLLQSISPFSSPHPLPFPVHYLPHLLSSNYPLFHSFHSHFTTSKPMTALPGKLPRGSVLPLLRPHVLVSSSSFWIPCRPSLSARGGAPSPRQLRPLRNPLGTCWSHRSRFFLRLKKIYAFSVVSKQWLVLKLSSSTTFLNSYLHLL